MLKTDTDAGKLQVLLKILAKDFFKKDAQLRTSNPELEGEMNSTA
jgi:hypothetical protein